MDALGNNRLPSFAHLRADCFAIPPQRKRVLMPKTNLHAEVVDEVPWSDGIGLATRIYYIVP